MDQPQGKINARLRKVDSSLFDHYRSARIPKRHLYTFILNPKSRSLTGDYSFIHSLPSLGYKVEQVGNTFHCTSEHA